MYVDIDRKIGLESRPSWRAKDALFAGLTRVRVSDISDVSDDPRPDVSLLEPLFESRMSHSAIFIKPLGLSSHSE